MSNLKPVTFSRTIILRKPRTFKKNKAFKGKNYTFTKMYCFQSAYGTIYRRTK